MQMVLLHGALEESAALVAGLLLDVRRRRGCVFNRKRETKFQGEHANKRFVFVGFDTPQMVVYMQNPQLGSELTAESVKIVQENDGIRSPGDRYANALGRCQHLVTAYICGDSFDKRGGQYPYFTQRTAAMACVL